MSRPDFVTFDLETTGLSARKDRIVEIGIVRTSAQGRVVGEFSTLVNPKRDIGPTEIHGITAGEVLSAPSFADISGAIAELVNGGVLVAHNAAFDRRFLIAELEREGRNFGQVDVVCTLQLMGLVYDGGPRRLADCCVDLGIELRAAHRALDDARMTSELLHNLITKTDLPFAPEPIWIDPKPSAERAPINRGDVSPRKAEAVFIQRLLGSLPARDDAGIVSAASVAQYLNLLDRVLEDRRVSSEEAEELVGIAGDLSLSSAQVKTLHASYLASLCAAARADGEVTHSERSDLAAVATLLSVDGWEAILDMEHLPVGPFMTKQTLVAGQSVCFTGGREADKREMAALAEGKGLVVKSGVSRKLDILVLADADSQSGKAQKAREYGTRMVAAKVFREMIQAMP